MDLANEKIANNLVRATGEGLYCEAGDFYIDPCVLAPRTDPGPMRGFGLLRKGFLWQESIIRSKK